MLLPLHRTFKTVVAVLNPEAGWVMVMVLVRLQAFASVRVTVLTPAFKVLITEVVAALDHKYE